MAPPTVADLNLWPYPLRRLCEAYGVDAVWTIGLDVLGYPPLWDPGGAEIAAIKTRLRAFFQPKGQ